MAVTSKLGRTHLESPWSVSSKRLEEIGWGLFLLLTGVLWLLPGDLVPTGGWLIGTGVLLIGMNIFRYVAGMPINLFTTILGTLALAGGVAERIGVTIPLLAIAIVVAGAILILRPLVRQKG